MCLNHVIVWLWTPRHKQTWIWLPLPQDWILSIRPFSPLGPWFSCKSSSPLLMKRLTGWRLFYITHRHCLHIANSAIKSHFLNDNLKKNSHTIAIWMRHFSNWNPLQQRDSMIHTLHLDILDPEAPDLQEGSPGPVRWPPRVLRGHSPRQKWPYLEGPTCAPPVAEETCGCGGPGPLWHPTPPTGSSLPCSGFTGTGQHNRMDYNWLD